jgi:hypothetical protein
VAQRFLLPLTVVAALVLPSSSSAAVKRGQPSFASLGYRSRRFSRARVG